VYDDLVSSGHETFDMWNMDMWICDLWWLDLFL
jgi:hypothetical protein